MYLCRIGKQELAILDENYEILSRLELDESVTPSFQASLHRPGLVVCSYSEKPQVLNLRGNVLAQISYTTPLEMPWHLQACLEISKNSDSKLKKEVWSLPIDIITFAQSA